MTLGASQGGMTLGASKGGMTLGALQMMLREGKRMAEGSWMWRGREGAVRCKVSVRMGSQLGEAHRLVSDWAVCMLPVPAADGLHLDRHKSDGHNEAVSDDLSDAGTAHLNEQHHRGDTAE